jgi:hypothetical protein
MNSNGKQIIKQGTWRYADEVPCDIRIVLEHVRPGTGDAGDDPAWRDDQAGTFFVIEYGAPGEHGPYHAGGGYFDSLGAAVAHAEVATHQTVVWDAQPPAEAGAVALEPDDGAGQT